MPKSKYRYVGMRASEVRVGENVVPVGMGEFITLDDSDLKHVDNEYVKDLLVPIKDSKASEGGDK